MGRNPLPTTQSGTGASRHYTRGKTYPRQVILSGKAWPVIRGLLQETSPPPVPPFPTRPAPPSPYIPKPCLTPGYSRGPMLQVLHGLQNTSTLRKRPRLLEVSSARFSMVPLPTYSSIRADFNRFVYSRGGHHVVLPMCCSTPQPRPSQRGGHQVVARIPHYGHVLVCDRVHRNEPPHSI